MAGTIYNGPVFSDATDSIYVNASTAYTNTNTINVSFDTEGTYGAAGAYITNTHVNWGGSTDSVDYFQPIHVSPGDKISFQVGAAVGAAAIGAITYNIAVNDMCVYVDSYANETAEEKQVRLAKEAEERKKREAAEKKARTLLYRIIGRAAYRRYRRKGYHEVWSQSGRRYRLRPGTMIESMDGNFGDKIDHRLCIHSDYVYGLPETDTLVQQMLLITSGEESEKLLLSTAIKHAA
jgi:hypothetical protein